MFSRLSQPRFFLPVEVCVWFLRPHPVTACGRPRLTLPQTLPAVVQIKPQVEPDGPALGDESRFQEGVERGRWTTRLREPRGLLRWSVLRGWSRATKLGEGAESSSSMHTCPGNMLRYRKAELCLAMFCVRPLHRGS